LAISQQLTSKPSATELGQCHFYREIMLELVGCATGDNDSSRFPLIVAL
jgi:hypothetical protein